MEPIAVPEDERLPAMVDEEVLRFERWFVSKGEEALTRYERAILRTYIHHRRKGSFPSEV